MHAFHAKIRVLNSGIAMLKKFLPTALFLTAIISFTVLNSSTALAENCKNLQSNSDWNANFSQMQNEISSGQYLEALNTAKVLYNICSKSPALNYYIGIAEQGAGDPTKATLYFQKASEYTFDFAVEPEMARLIWYARYEAENPERSDIAFSNLKQKLALQEKQLEEYKTMTTSKDAEIQTVRDLNEKAQTLVFDNQTNIHHYKTIMWTGTSIGIAGIGATIAGAVLAFTLSDKEKYEDVTENDENPQRLYHIRPKYTAGLATFGAGLALTLTGTLMAGFGGYYYTHLTKDVTVSFQASPTSATLSMTF